MATVWVEDKEKLPQRRDLDYYPTAIIDAERGLDFLFHTMSLYGETPHAPVVLDPGAGDGVWGNVLKRECPSAAIYGVELREVRRPEVYTAWAVGDFLAGAALIEPSFDLVIGNPPYKNAEQWIRRSLDVVKEGGYLLFLLRLTFLESQKRASGLFVEHPPLRVAVCGRRPSFSGNGKTSPDAYMYCIWRKGFQGEPTLTWV